MYKIDRKGGGPGSKNRSLGQTLAPWWTIKSLNAEIVLESVYLEYVVALYAQLTCLNH